MMPSDMLSPLNIDATVPFMPMSPDATRRGEGAPVPAQLAIPPHTRPGIGLYSPPPDFVDTSTYLWSSQPPPLYKSLFKPPTASQIRNPANLPPAWGTGPGGGGGYGGGTPWAGAKSRLPATSSGAANRLLTWPEENSGARVDEWRMSVAGSGKTAGGCGPDRWGEKLKAVAGWGMKWGGGRGGVHAGPWGELDPTSHSLWSAPIQGGFFGGGGGAAAVNEGDERGRQRRRRSNSRSRHRSKSRKWWNPTEHNRDGELKRSSSWGHAGDLADWPNTMFRRRPYPPLQSAEHPWEVNENSLGLETFDEHDPERRPRDQRADHPARSGLGGFLSRIGRVISHVKDYADPVGRQINPLLHHQSSSHPPVYFNFAPQSVGPENGVFRELSRHHNLLDLAQLALQPSTPFMRLFHPKLPWFIDIHQVYPSGVTIADVLQQTHQQLHVPIESRHFYNEDLNDSDRAVITLAFRERCRDDREYYGRGVIKLDFLEGNTVFEGLVRGPKGMWEMKMSHDRF